MWAKETNESYRESYRESYLVQGLKAGEPSFSVWHSQP